MGPQPLRESPISRPVAFTVLCFVVLGEFFGRGFAQELDTALQQRAESRFTVMDEVQDPRERAAFLELYHETAPDARHRLAERFIAEYPQSWLLSHAYEAAAKASIDLGSYPRAISEAKQSLSLFPENPLLLVPLANVAARQGLMPLAEQAAKDALLYLDEFGPPSGTKKKDWPKLKTGLQASAYFALGRAYATEALASAGKQKSDGLRKSFDYLTKALECNLNDEEIYYLRGVVQEALGNNIPAAEDYAESSRRGQTLREAAAKSLRRIYASDQAPPAPNTPPNTPKPSSGDPGFDQFLGTLQSPKIPSPAAVPNGTANPIGSYAGSSTCIPCHRREYESWQKTGMSRMLRPYKAENIMGDFGPTAEFRGDRGEVIRMGNDGRPYFELITTDGRPAKFHVDFTIGSKWQQGYVTRLPDGRLQVLPIEYSKIQGRWVNYWKVLDPPSSVRANISEFPKLLPDTNYQLNCAVCHTSQLRAASTGIADMMRARFEEPGVDCEMCHGPSKGHLDRMGRDDRAAQASAPPAGASKLPVDFLSNSNRDEVRVCAQCHRQSSVREASLHNELNYSSTGQTFILPAVSRNYPEFLRRAFYKDGRFRETTFIVEAFTRSACYRRGAARCSSCHDPHPADAETNPVSLKFLDNPDQRCLQCHEQFKVSPEKHTHHASASPGSRCESCHMPRIMNSVLFQARSHQIDDVPDAARTARFGQQDSPNACLLCHAEKDAAWVSDRLAHW